MPAQQAADTTFTYDNPAPSYTAGRGPAVIIDGGHQNFHTARGRFRPFARLLEGDGYRVSGYAGEALSAEVLAAADVYVISNALGKENVGRWIRPIASAFSHGEIALLEEWVSAGGRLLLIADHMPFAGAAKDLAAVFGFDFVDGFAMSDPTNPGPSIFVASDGLESSPVTAPTNGRPVVEQVVTFTGSAFRPPPAALPVLSFGEGSVSLQPDTAWRFSEHTSTVALAGYLQGALLPYGRGKVAVFGEAAMFSAQVAGGRRVGFNAPVAGQNAPFILNVMHWLTSDRKEALPVSDSLKIMNQLRRMEQGLVNNAPEKIAEVYADDAVIVGPGTKAAGREAVDAYWAGLRDRGTDWRLESEFLEVYPSVAVQRGVSKLTMLYEGREVRSDSRFTLVWKRDSTGRWRIAIDHYSPLE